MKISFTSKFQTPQSATHTHTYTHRGESRLVQFLHFLVAFLASINVNTFKAINNLSRQLNEISFAKEEKGKSFQQAKQDDGGKGEVRVYGLETKVIVKL